MLLPAIIITAAIFLLFIAGACRLARDADHAAEALEYRIAHGDVPHINPDRDAPPVSRAPAGPDLPVAGRGEIQRMAREHTCPSGCTCRGDA